MAKNMEALGMLEAKGFITLIEATDAMLKAANVEFIGWDKVGSGLVSVFIIGDVAAVKAGTDAGATSGGRIGEIVSVQVIPRPHDDINKVLPPRFVKKGGEAKPIDNAIGLVETRGLVALVEATDAMAKAANVEIMKKIQNQKNEEQRQKKDKPSDNFFIKNASERSGTQSHQPVVVC